MVLRTEEVVKQQLKPPNRSIGALAPTRHSILLPYTNINAQHLKRLHYLI